MQRIILLFTKIKIFQKKTVTPLIHAVTDYAALIQSDNSIFSAKIIIVKNDY